jgi:hypothetical protein
MYIDRKETCPCSVCGLAIGPNCICISCLELQTQDKTCMCFGHFSISIISECQCLIPECLVVIYTPYFQNNPPPSSFLTLPYIYIIYYSNGVAVAFFLDSVWHFLVCSFHSWYLRNSNLCKSGEVPKLDFSFKFVLTIDSLYCSFIFTVN